jgi:Tfp pilus assembly protein PilV
MSRDDERNQDGFTLVEVLAASVISILAITGLAYAFGSGRALINEFEAERAALAAAQQRLEILSVTPATSVDFDDSTHARPFNHEGRRVGTERWFVSWYDDPTTPGVTHDLRRVTVRVQWSRESRADTISLTRLFLPASP